MASTDFNVSKLKGALAGGGARPSLFDFTLTGVPTDVGTDLDNISYYCQVSALPPLTVTPIEKTYFGRTVKIPGDLVFADLSTTIINTEKFNVRNEIEKWMEQINGTISNESKTAADFGTGTAQLIHYQKDGSKTMTYQFEEIWPTAISEIALSYDTASDIEQFDVTWAYNYYTFTGGTVNTTFSTQG